MLFDYGYKDTAKNWISKFFLTFLYKMFREWYYKSLSVRMEIITNNAIIAFCHLVEVAIFAVTNFFSLFGIAVFNVPITHKLCFLLFLMQRYNLFSYLQFFLTFFHCLRGDLPTITNFIFVLCLYSSLCRRCSGGGVFRWCAGPAGNLIPLSSTLNF